MSSKITEIEAARGKPLREILVELYQQYGNLYIVAKELGVTQGTVSLWLIRCGLEVRSVVAPKDAQIVIQEAMPS